ncbi:retrovirus-related pol polyprotein from transposon TNT 1-94 [Tanacetum coccineum]
MLKIDVEPITPKLLNNKTAHSTYIKHTQEEVVVLRDLVEHVKSNYPLDHSLESAYSASGSQPSGNTKKDKIQRTPSSTQNNKVEAHPRTVKSSLKNKNSVVEAKGNANVKHSKLNMNYELLCVKWTNLGVQLFSCNLDSGCLQGYGQRSLQSAIRQLIFKSCSEVFPKLNLKKGPSVLLLVQWAKARRNPTNLNLKTLTRYTLSLGDMMASSPICLLLKASKTKSWLWHRRLSHLNFGAINHLARHGLVRGLPKLKFEKDHLCSACAMCKSKKKPHKPKSEDTN